MIKIIRALLSVAARSVLDKYSLKQTAETAKTHERIVFKKETAKRNTFEQKKRTFIDFP